MSEWIDVLKQHLTDEGEGPHVCVLATADGQRRPTARCMLCREVTNEGQVIFVSDRRTRKDSHLRERPEVEVVFWLEKQRVQFRVRGDVVVVGRELDNFERENWWRRISDESRAVFLTQSPWYVPPEESPASTADAPMPATFELLVLNPEEVELLKLGASTTEKAAWRKSGDQWSASTPS